MHAENFTDHLIGNLLHVVLLNITDYSCDIFIVAAVFLGRHNAGAFYYINGARIGLMGHTMEAMYDMHADPTAVSAAFGVHVPLLEVEDIVEVYETIKEAEIQEKIAVIDAEFDMPEPKSDPITSKLTDEDKYQAAKTAVALDKFVEKYNLTGLAYYYEGRDNTIQREVTSSLIVGNSILHA